MHVLSCFVSLQSVRLISCVCLDLFFFFSECWQSTLFQIFLQSIATKAHLPCASITRSRRTGQHYQIYRPLFGGAGEITIPKTSLDSRVDTNSTANIPIQLSAPPPTAELVRPFHRRNRSFKEQGNSLHCNSQITPPTEALSLSIRDKPRNLTHFPALSFFISVGTCQSNVLRGEVVVERC